MQRICCRMDTAVSDTLALALATGAVNIPETGNILFLRAAQIPLLNDLPADRTICHNTFKPDYDALEKAGHTLLAPSLTDLPPAALTIILPPRQRDEARALYARAIKAAPEGGVIVACLPNTLGGKTAEKTLKELTGNAESLSKHKCRAFWTRKDSATLNTALIDNFIALDTPAPVAEGAMVSRPGLFSWNRVDAGSARLIETLDIPLKGRGSDLGAGQGYLSKAALQKYPDITHIDLFEAEHRAIACATATLDGMGRHDIHWADVLTDLPENTYDFILTNPPFHTGRADNAPLGQSFIRAAARAIRPGGSVWLVANRHLPYEATLTENFRFHEIVDDAGGYKIIQATKPKRK